MRKVIVFILLLTVIAAVSFGGSNKTYADTNVNIHSVINDQNDPIEAEMELYPNPASDYIFLRMEEAIDGLELSVMSFIGTKLQVEVEKINQKLYKVDLSTVASGHYYLVLKADKKQSVKKFIKK